MPCSHDLIADAQSTRTSRMTRLRFREASIRSRARGLLSVTEYWGYHVSLIPSTPLGQPKRNHKGFRQGDVENTVEECLGPILKGWSHPAGSHHPTKNTMH